MSEFSFSSGEVRAVACDLGLAPNAFGERDSERMKIINHWESCHVQACPGSGKTTVLLTKLLLLSRRMPFKDGRGVCVLTHTNVAMDEIRSRLGYKADILFQHPNFFGTIQSFVDNYFFIPYCTRAFHVRPRIDDDLYASMLQRIYNLRDFPKTWFDKRGGFDYAKNIRYSFNNYPSLSHGLYGNLSLDPETNSYGAIKKAKEDIAKKGVFCFEDVFSVTKWYLMEHPQLSSYTKHRFKALFIDEMQDTQKHQMELIETIFRDAPIKQYYGDGDQAIFHGIGGGQPAWIPKNSLQMTDSKRFGAPIADVAFNFSQNITKLVGNDDIDSLEPHILLFADPSKVLPKFSSLIQEYKLDKEYWDRVTPKFNAVGFVGKRDEKIDEDKKQKVTICSYHNTFTKSNSAGKKYYKTLISYFQQLPLDFVRKYGTGVYYDFFLSGLMRLLENGAVKNPDVGRHFTKVTYRDFLKKKHEADLDLLNENISTWIVQVHLAKKNAAQIKEDFLEFFEVTLEKKHSDFRAQCYGQEYVTSDYIEPASCVTDKENIYVDEATGIRIQIGTIHSVKGKTHMSTLLLPTENDRGAKDEASHFFNAECGNLFCGDRYEKPRSYKIIENRLKSAYVAFTRPTKLLCVALPKNKVNCSSECRNTSTCKWKVIEVD